MISYKRKCRYVVFFLFVLSTTVWAETLAMNSSENRVITLPMSLKPAVPNHPDYKAIRRYISVYHPEIKSLNAETICYHIVSQSQTFNLDPKLVAALISLESGFHPKAVGRGGSSGLGQLMPGTARALGVRDCFDIEDNIAGTTKYLKGMMDIWRNSETQVRLALASYNRGSGPIIKSKGKLGRHTNGYVNAVMSRYKKIQKIGWIPR